MSHFTNIELYDVTPKMHHDIEGIRLRLSFAVKEDVTDLCVYVCRFVD